MLSKTNNFQIKYKIVNQILEIYKTNIITLKIIMILNSYWHTLEKCKILLKLRY